MKAWQVLEMARGARPELFGRSDTSSRVAVKADNIECLKVFLRES